jgi:membrane associated rhomboid family serine protease
MRLPPSPSRLLELPITAGVIALALAMTALGLTGSNVEPLSVGREAFHGQPWRLLTSALLHGGWLHLLFNAYFYWSLGAAVELHFGHLRAGVLAALFAAGSMTAEYALSSNAIGLSGVVYGWGGLGWILGRRDPRFAEVVDRRTVEALAIWFLLCALMTALGYWRVANVAHGAGALLGVLAGAVIAGRHRRAAAATLILFCIASAAGATALRPYVNFTRAAGAELALFAFRAQQAGRAAQAADLYEQALKLDDNADWLYNLGIAYETLGQLQPSLERLERAFRKDPHRRDFRQVFIDVKRAVAIAALDQGRIGDAARLFRELTELDPNGAHWSGLAAAEFDLGNIAEGLRAMRQAAALDALGQGAGASAPAPPRKGDASRASDGSAH